MPENKVFARLEGRAGKTQVVVLQLRWVRERTVMLLRLRQQFLVVQTAFAFILNLKEPLLIQNHAIAVNGPTSSTQGTHMQVHIKQGTLMTRCISGRT